MEEAIPGGSYLTPQHLIHPLDYGEVPNSSSGGTGNEAEACSQSVETNTENMTCESLLNLQKKRKCS